MDAALDEGASVSLLERLNEAVDTRAVELQQIQQGATEAADNLTQAQASPDLQDSLNRRPALELMWAVAQRNETPDQRQGLHKLLRSLRLALVLDDTDPAALRVGMGCDGEVWDWQPFLGKAEPARLFVEGVVLGPMKEHMPSTPDSSGLRIDPGAISGAPMQARRIDTFWPPTIARRVQPTPTETTVAAEAGSARSIATGLAGRVADHQLVSDFGLA
jgi:hypothetical protein